MEDELYWIEVCLESSSCRLKPGIQFDSVFFCICTKDRYFLINTFMKVHYLVYKLTNLVNGKIYIGCHMTKDVNDDYMGSGRRLSYAKKKYGIENFKKEILSAHETPEEMLAEEARLVNEEFLGRDDVYNLTVGGKGSWFHTNQLPKMRKIRQCNINKSRSNFLKIVTLKSGDQFRVKR